ncbi:MAG: hypothetical protein AB7E81_14575 [Hyphomicrobiaceae bacterium]
MTEQGPQGRPPTELTDEARRLAGMALARIATEPSDEAAILRDLGQILGAKGGSDIWRVEVGRLVAALVAGDLAERDGAILRATGQGVAAATEFLAAKKGLPRNWAAARDLHLVANALGLAAAPESRLRLLRKSDGLRAMIVVSHWQLKIKGQPSASRIRSALAAKALEHAFGKSGDSKSVTKSELPPKAARLLASKLSSSGREFGSDGRLIAALAAEAIGARRTDWQTLQLAVLRRYLGRSEVAVSKKRLSRGLRNRGSPKQLTLSLAMPNAATTSGADCAVHPIPALGPQQLQPGARPDPAAFASAVHAATAETADGWAGNRKAFISKVWAVIQARHSAWALTEIEFKCMLTEAHRTGLIVLANADLKDKRALKELQDSAVVYKNTVWHYVRAAD